MRLASVWVLVAAVSWAGQKTVIVTAGDCSDAALISGAKDFRDTTRKLAGADVMEQDVVLDIVRPRPTRSVQDLERQVDSAKTLFYGGQNERALELLDRALTELERAEPDARPWKVTENALVLQALVFKNLERTKDMQDSFRRVLRISPTTRLDPEVHSPSTIAAFEAVKKEVTRAKKTTLSVRVDGGPAASVAVDGQVLGTTPLKVDLVPGSYRVALFNGAALSFPHRVELPRDNRLSVDLSFEGAVSRRLPLCLTVNEDDEAIKLAQLVSAERLIVLRNLGKTGAPPYLSGALYDVGSGRQERTGAVAPDLMPALATFLVTGREQAGVRRPDAPPPVAQVVPQAPPPSGLKSAPVEKEPEKKPAETPKETVKEVAVLTPPPAPVGEPVAPVSVPAAPVPLKRVVGYTLIGTGAAAVLAGVFSIVSSYTIEHEPERYPATRLASIFAFYEGKFPPDSAPAVQAEARALMADIETRNTVGTTLIGAGVGAIIGGALTMVLFPDDGPRVAVAPVSGGAAFSLSGSF